MVISCGEIINPSPIFNEANASVGMVAKSMTDNNLGGMPIVENSGNMKLVGFVDDHDIVKLVAFGRDARNTPAYEIMTPDPVTCTVKDALSFALDVMDKCHLQRLPIVSTDKRLLGVIEHSEILKYLEQSQEQSVQRDELCEQSIQRKEFCEQSIQQEESCEQKKSIDCKQEQEQAQEQDRIEARRQNDAFMSKSAGEILEVDSM